MTAAFVLFIVLCSASAFGGAFSARRFEQVLPLSVFSIIAILYCFGLFDALLPGVVVVSTVALVLWTMALIRIIRTYAWRSFAQAFFTPAFCFYLAVFVLALVCNYGRKVSSWDDLTQWADVVRQMAGIHKFGASAEAFTFFPNYPPAMALLQYYVQVLNSLFTGADFCEWLLFLAYSSALYALFVPFMGKLQYKNWLTNLCIVGTAFLLPGILHRGLFRLLEIDPFLSVLAGYGLAAVWLKRKDAITAASCVLCAFVLTLSKTVGLYFSVTLCIALLVTTFINKPNTMNTPRRAQRILTPCLAGATTAFAYLSWEWYMRKNATFRAFSGRVRLDVLWRLLLGRENGYYQQAWILFWKHLFVPEYHIGVLNFRFSFLLLFLIILTLVGVFLIIRRRSQNFAALKSVFFMGIVSAAVFVPGMCLTYLFKFSEYEALHFACFDRYMGIPLLMLMVLLFLCFTVSSEYNTTRRQRVIIVVLLSILLIAAPAQQVVAFVLGFNRSYSAGIRKPVDQIIEHILPKLEDGTYKINVVSLGDGNGLNFLMFRYALRPHHVAGAWNEVPNVYSDTDIWDPAPQNAAEWRARLLNEHYDYVLLYQINDDFRSIFSDLFEGGATSIHTGVLYAVDPNNPFLTEVD